MAAKKASSAKVALTGKQIQEGLGAELFALCQEITADGQLSKQEILQLRKWLKRNRHADIPGIDFLSRVLDAILADGHVTVEEHKHLFEAIEKVLPPDSRFAAKVARKSFEERRKNREKAKKEEEKERLKKQRELEALAKPIESFNFLVAGVHYENRDKIVQKYVQPDDRIYLLREPTNKYDRFAVRIILSNGKNIGFVPKVLSQSVSECLDDFDYYIATVVKIYYSSVPIPVIQLDFFEADQLEYIREKRPSWCSNAKPRKGQPWWKFW